MGKLYTVWVGGTEVNDYLMSEYDADELADQWIDDGYDDVSIQFVRDEDEDEEDSNKWEDTELQALRFVDELCANVDVDLTPMREAMDLEEEQFNELIERIRARWEERK